MSKQVYISADYAEDSGDRDVVEVLTQWGSDNLHKVDFIDMAQVASGSVSEDADCRPCDLKLEFNRQINASSAVIFVVGDKTATRKLVHVVVDRPVGYQHGNIEYPINYGYIPGLIAGDSEEQDVYILGISEPITEFDGQVVAAICRRNDCEDKLVVVPAGSVYHQGQIAEAVHFQEQYFCSRIISCFEKSCGVLPYRMVDGQQEFLLVFETYSKCWSLPKGHIEMGETDVQAALRELYEETGMTAALDVSKTAAIEYPISDFARKQVVFFLGEVSGETKVREGEIDKFKWVTVTALKDYLFPDTYKACQKLLR